MASTDHEVTMPKPNDEAQNLATPRPWRQLDQDYGLLDILGPDDMQVAAVYQCGGIREIDEAEANAKLIIHAVNSLSANERQVERLREALRGVSRRILVGWEECWCEKNPYSANIVDHETACSAARAALQSEEESNGNV